MPGSPPSPADLDPKRRRARFRSWHRGMREMDLLMGKFADARIAALSDAEIDDFEALLELPDHDVFMWLCGEDDAPVEYDTPVFRQIKLFHSHDKPLEL